jgi:hypothetical protein
MAEDDPAPTNTPLHPAIGFNTYTAEEQKILQPGKALEDATPPRVLPWSKNLGDLNADQIRSSRERWVKAGNDPAVFDRAAELDGHSVPDIEAEKLARNHGLQTPHPREIQFQHSNAQKHNSELTGFIQAARLNGSLGASIIDHIADQGPRVASMSAAEQTAWTLAQEKLGLTLSGGRKNWEAAKANAKAFLDRLKTVDAKSGGDFAKNLSQSALMGSAYLVCTFATSQEMWTSYAAAAARRKK